MDDLQTTYRRALPGRIAELEAAGSAGGGAADATIRGIAHALRGSGATYGFPQVTSAAAAVEESDSDHLQERVNDLIAVLRDVAEGPRSSIDEDEPPLRVLLVDDDPEIRLIVSFLLREAGYVVSEAADAAAAGAALAAEHIDVLLMDYSLGDDDGVETSGALFRSLPGPPPRLIFLTGAVRAEQFERMNAAGAAGIIHKPFDPDSFLSLFQRLLGARA